MATISRVTSRWDTQGLRPRCPVLERQGWIQQRRQRKMRAQRCAIYCTLAPCRFSNSMVPHGLKFGNNIAELQLIRPLLRPRGFAVLRISPQPYTGTEANPCWSRSFGEVTQSSRDPRHRPMRVYGGISIVKCISAHSRGRRFRTFSAHCALDVTGALRISSYCGSIGWFGRGSEGRSTAPRLDPAGHQTSPPERNRSRSADSQTFSRI